jgi:hAT family C-terminal dimerisation region
MARILLEQACTSSSIERVWSTNAYIHDNAINCLAKDRAEKLVYTHYNLRMVDAAHVRKEMVDWIPDLIGVEEGPDGVDDIEVVDGAEEEEMDEEVLRELEEGVNPMDE